MIDHAALITLGASVLFLLFLTLLENIPAACALSFITCSVLLFILRRCIPSPRMKRMEAEALLNSWIFGDDEKARSSISEILNMPKDSYSLFVLIRHPSSTISVGDIFTQWKNNLGTEHITIAATCRLDPRGKLLAGTLREPTVEIIDISRLISLIRCSELHPPKVRKLNMWFQHLRNAILILPTRLSWHRSLLYGLLLLLVYFITASAGYLFLGIAALFLSGVSIRAQRS